MGRLQSRTLPKEPKAKKAKSKVPFATKKRQEEARKRIRDLNKQVREQLEDDQDKARQARKAQKQRRAENEQKNMVVQNIKNIKAIKKLSPKQRHRARIFLKHELK